jgi:phosphoglycolate phosphatase-like HAD superfamily hydrolase
MKNVFASLTLCALMSIGAAAPAVAGDGTSKTSTRATEMTRRMAEHTRLTEGQYVKVRALNLRLLNETAELRRQFATDAAKLDEAVAEMQLRYEWDLATILRPRQMVAYDEMKSTLTAVNIR